MADPYSRQFGHIPVLAREAVEALCPVDRGVYVDATLGGGGYTRQLLSEAGCRVFAFDRDPVAIQRAAAWSGAFGDRLTLLAHPFAEMYDVLTDREVHEVNGVVFDLGVSSVQLDEADRGFSFMRDGPLNMRMDQSERFSASDFINMAAEKDMADIFYIYGEEKKSRLAAKAIVQARSKGRIDTTGQLADLLKQVLGARGREKIHPATRIFQAIRIFINDELGQLVRGLLAAERLLAPAGRLAVVTFHSLEDRIVKRFLALRSGSTGTTSRHMPEAAAMAEPTFSLLYRKAKSPTAEEQKNNPRARSAKLRVGVRTGAVAVDADPGFLKAVGLPQLTLSAELSNWS